MRSREDGIKGSGPVVPVQVLGEQTMVACSIQAFHMLQQPSAVQLPMQFVEQVAQ